MKKLLFGLSASLLLSTAAHAQDAPPFILRVPQLPLTALELEPVEGKPDVFTLKPGKYNVRELLAGLAAKTGGKALFDNQFKLTTLSLYQPFQGTVSQIIEKLGLFGMTVGQIGTDWVFVQVKSETPVAPSAAAPFSVPPAPPKMAPFDFNFNKNRNSGPNLPPNATPFEFNGERVYHVPIRPNGK